MVDGSGTGGAPVLLSVPEITADADSIGAAVSYANSGGYVLPVRRGGKHAGSVLGEGWPAMSSRDPDQIGAWFAGTDHAVALHVGRSGAVVFDVDRGEDGEVDADAVAIAVAEVLADRPGWARPVVHHGDQGPKRTPPREDRPTWGRLLDPNAGS